MDGASPPTRNGGDSTLVILSSSTSRQWLTRPRLPRSGNVSRTRAASCCSLVTTASLPQLVPRAAWRWLRRPAQATSWRRRGGSGTEWERDASLRLREADPAILGEYHRRGRIIDGGTIEQAEASAARAWLADTVSERRSVLIVDTNEQAARVSAALRAELVRLGRVEEVGVPLGLQGTYAGVGDLVQARKNAWQLAGVHGNARGPINRETYRVVGYARRRFSRGDAAGTANHGSRCPPSTWRSIWRWATRRRCTPPRA